MSAMAIANLIIAFLLVITGAAVFAKNHKDYLNLTFFAFSIFFGLWIIVNYYSNDLTLPLNIAYLTNHLVLFFSGSALVFLALFSARISRHRLDRFSTLILSVGMLSALSSLTGFVVEDITPQEGVYAIEFGALALLYFGGLFLNIGIILWTLFYGYYTSQGAMRSRILVILWSFGLTALFAMVTNIIIPLTTGVFEFTNLGPLSVSILVLGIAYAIVQHRLFDIRLAVARSMAYVLVILTLGLVYGYLVFGFIDSFFTDTGATTLQQALYTISAVFLAFTFQPLKRFFDRLTSRIFYRDRYDSGDVLNRLGKVFVAKSNSFDLVDESLRIIADTLKVEFARIMVIDKGSVYKTAHIGAHEDMSIPPRELTSFTAPISLVDSMDEAGVLSDMNVYAIVQLKTRSSLVGYLILGAKHSGTVYTQQDINFLEILSQELSVAIQNAKSYEEIQAFSETLKKEVDDATAQLRETNKRLIKLDEAKDEFISMASHQLRTPLTTIKGYLSMLLDGDAGKLPKKQAEFVDMAFVSSQRMVHLIADMLNVSRISTGRLTIDKTSFDIAEVVESELEQLHRQAEARGVDLRLQKPEEPVIVELDENKVRQVIMNFTDNAVYYSPNGEVNVSVDNVDGWVEVKIQDNGIGVSEEAQKQLFTKFFRAENAQAVRPDGTGLGLYMAKQVVEAQDGEIIFKSKEGEGSTFGFRFRLKDK